MKTETGSSRIEKPTWKLPAVSHSHPVERWERASGLSPSSPMKATSAATKATRTEADAR